MMFLSTLLQVLSGMAFLTGVPLNSYVLFVASCRVERTVSAIWFWNRALADFIFIIFLPIRLISIFDFDCTWRLSSTITSLHMFSSAFLLTALSVDRCILVACPEWVQNRRTLPLSFGVVMGLWALSLGFSLRYGDVLEYLFPPPRIRRYFQPDAGRVKAAIAIQFLVGFLIPFALILIPTFYIILAAKLRRNRLIQSTKPLKILLGLIPTFFLCWLPYHVFSFLLISDMYPPPELDKISAIASVVTYFSSCLNPIFYLTMEEEFRRYQQRACKPQTSDNSGPEPDE
ncbi:C3a anaphylatoxin chemotactic receptor-like [Trachemys scripta elegans]|uniref:C3a anaphylatoxin chemotactic receptor-like n=1 Tax=Trachemys scripta elegans TaxID=31138 RepID=UPI00155225ED|nr:C3a anaphylatoxin chemotactic receptor-like [Trachemys scripta elegans]